MEEILASIRRIIADEQASAQPAAPPQAQVAVQPPVRTARPLAPIVAQAPQSQPVAPVEAAPATPATPSEFEAWLAQTANAPLPPVKPAPSRTTAEPAYSAPVVSLQPRAAETIVEAPAVEHQAEAPVADTYEAPVVEEPQPAATEYYLEHQPAPAHDVGQGWHAPHLSVVPPAGENYAPSAAPDAELDAPLRPGFDTGDLLSDAAGSSVQSSFQALARTMFMQNTGMVEEAVREMLRPMLKQWLDDNLPPVVERLVRAEIERVARGIR